jgi:hypothetical protein
MGIGRRRHRFERLQFAVSLSILIAAATRRASNKQYSGAGER